jgi:hypothetical protein
MTRREIRKTRPERQARIEAERLESRNLLLTLHGGGTGPGKFVADVTKPPAASWVADYKLAPANEIVAGAKVAPQGKIGLEHLPLPGILSSPYQTSMWGVGRG